MISEKDLRIPIYTNGQNGEKAIGNKPQTMLKRVLDVLKPNSEGENPQLYIAGIYEERDPNVSFSSFVRLFVSPTGSSSKSNIEGLNKFAIEILAKLNPKIPGHYTLMDLEPAKKSEDGISLPRIRYKSEKIGDKIETLADISDPLRTEDAKIVKKEIKRLGTEIVIFPNPNMARSALLQAENRINGSSPNSLLEITMLFDGIPMSLVGMDRLEVSQATKPENRIKRILHKIRAQSQPKTQK